MITFFIYAALVIGAHVWIAALEQVHAQGSGEKV